MIPTRSRRYVLDARGVINCDRYEFLIYRMLREGLEAGDLYCRDSVRFCCFDDDLIDEETSEQRADLLPRHDLQAAGRPIREQLEELRTLLDERFESVNRHILDGENVFVRTQDSRTVWEQAVHSLELLPSEHFFDMVERADINTVLLFVDRRNGFMEAFEHVQGRYRKAPPSKPVIIASLMAHATNIGLVRIADIYPRHDAGVDFALLHLFGYRFAPRHHKVRSKLESALYGFHHTNHYKDCPLKPVHGASRFSMSSTSN